MRPVPIEATLLRSPGVTHGFFTRHGGVSTGVYATLNGGVGSSDAPERVAENRRRMAAHLAVDPNKLLVPYQTHSPDAVIVTEAFTDRPRCDALVTAVPGLALGVTGADCGIVLLADTRARVVGAAHAGWKGALGGVLEATLDAMERIGANRASITAVLGPTIGQKSYEVGAEFFERFVMESKDYASFFVPSPHPGAAHRWRSIATARSQSAVSKDEGELVPLDRPNGRFLFDLPGFIGMRLERAGVGTFEDLALDTYADETRFYSYRRSVHRAEPDYGRQVAAIVLV
jgi:YfiH family protein